MDGARIVGFLFLGLALLGSGLLGAPLYLLALIAAVPLVTLLLPGGVGAAAASNLAQKLYDRGVWQVRWDRGYLADREVGRVHRSRGEEVPPDLFPDDLEESKRWLRTLAAIRALPERQETAHRSMGIRRRRQST